MTYICHNYVMGFNHMNGIINVKNGVVILDQIRFTKMFPSKKVIKHDKLGKQGKIVLPGELIGKKVIVIVIDGFVPEDGRTSGQTKTGGQYE